MDWNITNTQYLIENTLNKDEVIKYLALNKGLCVSAQTLDCYMCNYQAFPRFISVYNPETLCREHDLPHFGGPTSMLGSGGYCRPDVATGA